jgi:hypothetical protein
VGKVVGQAPIINGVRFPAVIEKFWALVARQPAIEGTISTSLEEVHGHDKKAGKYYWIH